MSRALARRVVKLETVANPPALIPTVLHIAPGEAIEAAIRVFAARYPKAPRNHRLLIVPRRDRTAEDEAAFAVEFKRQQIRSMAEARSQPKEVIC